MKIVFLIGIFTTFINSGICQSTGCIDTTSTLNIISKVNSSSFQQISDYDKNLYLKWDTAFQNLQDYKNIIVKLSPGKNVLYNKLINQSLENQGIKYDISHANSMGQLFLSGGQAGSGQSGVGALAKLDINGNMLWQKRYGDILVPGSGFYFRNTSKSLNDEIITMPSFTDAGNVISRYAVLNGEGEIKWAKEYYIQPKQGENPAGDQSSKYLSLRNNIIVAEVESISFAPQRKKIILSLLQLDKQTGVLTKSNTYQFAEDMPYSSPNEHVLRNFSYDTLDHTFYLSFKTSFQLNDTICLMKFNENFEFINGAVFTGVNMNLQYKSSFDTKSQFILCSRPRGNNAAIVFTVIDKNFNIVYEKKISDTSFLPIYTTQHLYAEPYLLNNEFAGIAINTYENSGGVDFVNIISADHSFQENPYCYLYDTLALHGKAFNRLKSTDYSYSENTINLPDPVAITNATMESRDLLSQNVCTKISNCDTIKLSGLNQYCLSKDTISFTFYRNPDCLRKPQWQFDESKIRIISVSNDTLKIVFKQSFTGYLYAGFEGCNLKDSIFLEVYSKQPKVDLGLDQQLCPGEDYTINAGNKYKKYLWQNGSSDSIYQVKDSGKYYILVEDFCANISTDTIQINYTDTSFDVSYPSLKCHFDTAVVPISPLIDNVSIYPAKGMLYSNNKLILFPDKTTIYEIRGTKMGCSINDTILIRVQNCPQQIFFPAAFTPNNDGLNDFFKPIINGRISDYELMIFNRWGQLLFKTNSQVNGWNGYFKSSPLESGTYIWMCRYKFLNNAIRMERGSLLLIN